MSKGYERTGRSVLVTNQESDTLSNFVASKTSSERSDRDQDQTFHSHEIVVFDVWKESEMVGRNSCQPFHSSGVRSDMRMSYGYADLDD